MQIEENTIKDWGRRSFYFCLSFSMSFFFVHFEPSIFRHSWRQMEVQLRHSLGWAVSKGNWRGPGFRGRLWFPLLQWPSLSSWLFHICPSLLCTTSPKLGTRSVICLKCLYGRPVVTFSRHYFGAFNVLFFHFWTSAIDVWARLWPKSRDYQNMFVLILF